MKPGDPLTDISFLVMIRRKDTIQDGQHVGAMSWAFITALTKKPRQSYLELLQNVRHELRSNHYTQTPQLSCSHDIGKYHSRNHPASTGLLESSLADIS